jgi:hypothetical protein
MPPTLSIRNCSRTADSRFPILEPLTSNEFGG